MTKKGGKTPENKEWQITAVLRLGEREAYVRSSRCESWVALYIEGGSEGEGKGNP
jgi:hypothetical protein